MKSIVATNSDAEAFVSDCDYAFVSKYEWSLNLVRGYFQCNGCGYLGGSDNLDYSDSATQEMFLFETNGVGG